MFHWLQIKRQQWLSILFVIVFLTILWSKVPASGESLIPSRSDSLSAIAPAQPTQKATAVRKTVLENGLTVLTKEVHTAPVVSVQIWYRVGSRNETAGINGIAHQLEHLMFKGTTRRPIQFGRFFAALGSDSNAFTSFDQTAYFGTVQQNQLRSLLTLESDRMMNSIIDEEALKSEKRVVISELQGYENSPSYRLDRAVMKAALPNSPYGLPVGGTKADVEGFTVEQVRQYYRDYYRPDNAVLVIVGDIQTDSTLAMVKELFGSIRKPTTPLPAPPAKTPIASSTTKTPIVLKEPGSAPLFSAVYPLPDVTHPDIPALQVMDYVLTGGRSSRFYNALLESGLTSDANAGVAAMMGGGWYEISATAAPGKSLSAIDTAIQTLVGDLQTKGISPEELDRAKAQLRASLILRNRDIAAQAMQLGDDESSTGDYQFSDRLLVAIERVTAADVQRVAKTYLKPDYRTVGYFEPTQVTAAASEAPRGGQTSEQLNTGAPVDPAELAKYLPPSANQSPSKQTLPERFTLKNGLTVLLLPDKSTPTVTLSGHIRAGSLFDTAEKAGVANLTAANVMNGTQQRSALELAKTLENRGARLGFGANREGVTISGVSLSADFPTLTHVLAEVLQTAIFPQTEFDLSRQRSLSALAQELDNPNRLGRRVIQQTIYPANHPFHSFTTNDSLTKITREDLQTFYQTHYRPDTTVLTIVGDFDPTQVKALLNQSLGQWSRSGEKVTPLFPTVGLPNALSKRQADMPGKTQSVTLMGYNSISRKDPRYYAALVMNQILGGDTLSSRLGTEIRDRQGLTYGINSYFQAGIHEGPFLITMQTAPEDADKAIAGTLTVLRQMREKGVSASEVANAVRSITGSYPVGLADPDSLAGTILANETYGLNPDEIRMFVNKLRSLTPAQVNQVIQDLLHPDKLVIVTAGPNQSR